MNVDQLYRSAVLGIAGNAQIKQLVQTRGWNLASRFVAGELVVLAGRLRVRDGEAELANPEILGHGEGVTSSDAGLRGVEKFKHAVCGRNIGTQVPYRSPP